MRFEDIEANYASMADIARANNIRLVFSSVLPVHNYTPQMCIRDRVVADEQPGVFVIVGQDGGGEDEVLRLSLIHI